MAYLGGFVFYGNRVLDLSDSIRKLPLPVVDKTGAVDLCALGGRLDIWCDGCARGNFWDTEEHHNVSMKLQQVARVAYTCEELERQSRHSWLDLSISPLRP